MERKRSHDSLTITMLVALLLVVVPVMSTTFQDNKNYYSPDPHAAGTPPSSGGSHGSSPSHGSGGGHGSPHHGTPSHGGSSGSNNCGTPPVVHDPPSTPSNPPSHGGGYYNSPPTTPIISVSPPSNPPVYPGTPPVDPGTPTLPSPPFFPVPFTGTCTFWINHPGMIWGVLGWWGTLGNAFGGTNGVPGVSPGLTLPQALSNRRTDGIGALLREGTASYLNSLVNHKFPYTTSQVRDRFVASLNSNKAASAQAKLFKMANEGKIKA